MRALLSDAEAASRLVGFDLITLGTPISVDTGMRSQLVRDEINSQNNQAIKELAARRGLSYGTYDYGHLARLVWVHSKRLAGWSLDIELNAVDDHLALDALLKASKQIRVIISSGGLLHGE